MEDFLTSIAGKVVGIYELESILGEPGTQGVVCKATNLQEMVPASVKILLNQGEDELRRFNRMAEIESSLNHPNIVKVQYYGYDKPYELFYVGYDFVRAKSLEKVLKDKPNGITIEETVYIASQITGALGHAHKRGPIHLDLKPDNILIGDYEETNSIISNPVFIIDFGFGIWPRMGGVGTHVKYGTLLYWAPEQVREENLTERTDLYLFGVVLYELLTGDVPFRNDQTKVRKQILEEQPIPPSKINQDLPESIDSFFSQALAKNPEDRFADIEEMYKSFVNACPNETQIITFPIPRGEELPPVQSVTSKDGVEIAFTDIGEGEPLIFIPPWVSNQAIQWGAGSPLVDFLEELAEKFRLISYDKRECGLSRRPDIAINDVTREAQLWDLQALINHLKLDCFSIFAISAGGPLAISYASRNPQKVSNLILYGTYANGSNIITDEEKKAQIALVKAYWGRGEAGRFFSDIFLPIGGPAEHRWLTRYQLQSSSPEHAAEFLAQIYSDDVTNDARNITCPTLIIHRFSDRAIPYKMAEELKSLIPHAKLVRLEGNVHVPWVNRRPTLNGIFKFCNVG